MIRKIVGPLLLILLAATALLIRSGDSENKEAPDSPSKSAPRSSPVPPQVSVTSAPPAPGPTELEPGPDPHEPKTTSVGPGNPAVPADKAQAQVWASARTTATTFLTAFARPSGSNDSQAWWRGVKKHLSPRVTSDYESIDPTQVPFSRITGPARIVPTDAPDNLVLVVQIPTDSGNYLVELETTEAGQLITSVAPVGVQEVP